MIGKMSLLVRRQAGKRMILSLVFLCFGSVMSLGIVAENGSLKFNNHAQAFWDTTAMPNINADGTGTNGDQTKVMEAANGTTGGGSWLLLLINWFLYAVFKFLSAIVVIAAMLFDWAVTAENFKQVMNMSSIQTGWIIFRDFLNIFFILILLFSAFCTIFQVSKYHIKNILLTLVIMALLVNFSFPVSRAIIDAGNIPMYHFLKAIGGGTGDSLSKRLWNDTNGNAGMQEFILPGTKNISDVTMNNTANLTMSLIAAIVFVFLFGLTLLVMAVLLVIRILVLALLVMASPIGFVGAIFPSLSKYSTQWWEQLFKQSFFGTIMAFMLYISLSIMKESQTGFAKKLGDAAATGKTGDFSAIIVGGVTLAIPIILLWIAMISAQKMGAAGASSVVGQATKVAKWAGKKFSGYNVAKRQVDAYKAARKERENEKAKHSFGGKAGRGLNRGQDWLTSKIPIVGGAAGKRYKKMKTDDNNKKINDGAETLIGASASTIVGSAAPTFGRNTSKSGKIDDAKQARAYIKMDFNERKDFVDSDITGKAASAGVQKVVDLTAAELGITDAAAVIDHAAKQAAVVAITTRATGAATPAEFALVNRFMNNQMNAVVKKGSNA